MCFNNYINAWLFFLPIYLKFFLGKTFSCVFEPYQNYLYLVKSTSIIVWIICAYMWKIYVNVLTIWIRNDKKWFLRENYQEHFNDQKKNHQLITVFVVPSVIFIYWEPAVSRWSKTIQCGKTRDRKAGVTKLPFWVSDKINRFGRRFLGCCTGFNGKL